MDGDSQRVGVATTYFLDELIFQRRNSSGVENLLCHWLLRQVGIGIMTELALDV